MENWEFSCIMIVIMPYLDSLLAVAFPIRIVDSSVYLYILWLLEFIYPFWFYLFDKKGTGEIFFFNWKIQPPSDAGIAFIRQNNPAPCSLLLTMLTN